VGFTKKFGREWGKVFGGFSKRDAGGTTVEWVDWARKSTLPGGK